MSTAAGSRHHLGNNAVSSRQHLPWGQRSNWRQRRSILEILLVLIFSKTLHRYSAGPLTYDSRSASSYRVTRWSLGDKHYFQMLTLRRVDIKRGRTTWLFRIHNLRSRTMSNKKYGLSSTRPRGNPSWIATSLWPPPLSV